MTPAVKKLTARQLQVCELLAQGLNANAIGRELSPSISGSGVLGICRTIFRTYIRVRRPGAFIPTLVAVWYVEQRAKAKARADALAILNGEWQRIGRQLEEQRAKLAGAA